jgi:hypothetical protein
LKEGRKDASEDKTNPEPIDDSAWKEKMEFVIKHKDLDEEQIDMLSTFAKGKAITLDEAYKDKLVLKVIEEDMREKKIANATPDGKSQSPEFKDFNRQVGEAVTQEGHKKLWKQVREGGKFKGVQTE